MNDMNSQLFKLIIKHLKIVYVFAQNCIGPVNLKYVIKCIQLLKVFIITSGNLSKYKQ